MTWEIERWRVARNPHRQQWVRSWRFHLAICPHRPPGGSGEGGVSK